MNFLFIEFCTSSRRGHGSRRRSLACWSWYYFWESLPTRSMNFHTFYARSLSQNVRHFYCRYRAKRINYFARWLMASKPIRSKCIVFGVKSAINRQKRMESLRAWWQMQKESEEGNIWQLTAMDLNFTLTTSTRTTWQVAWVLWESVFKLQLEVVYVGFRVGVVGLKKLQVKILHSSPSKASK